MNVIIKAGSWVIAGDSSGTRAKWENPFQHFQGLPHRLGTGKWAEVAPSILVQATGNIHPGPIFIEVNLEVGESLIIFKSDVVMRTVSLYQVVLKDESLLFRIGIPFSNSVRNSW